MNSPDVERLITEDEVANIRRILFDTPLETDEDYLEFAALVDDETEECDGNC